MQSDNKSRRFKRLCAGLGLGISLIALAGAGDDDKPKFTVKEVMEKAHKGKTSLAKKATDGKATKEELTQLLEYYQSMAMQKPEKGDLADWKKRSDALVSSTQKMIDGEKSGIAAYKKAVDCKACHTLHKED
ncbi:MAG: hypothetical protein JWL69_1781 [Phycisphaerales bacterium]|jgi:hypothetical protein|nr:hypothetical protein [Phycisphaerales bacterium]